MILTEQQKNCPYCHYPWKKIPVIGQEEDEDTLCFEQYETNGPHKLIKTTKILHDYAIFPWVIVVNRNPKHCEMCGRPLNEEPD